MIAVIGDVIDTLRETTPAFSQKFVRKRWRRVPVTSFILKNLICQSSLLSYAILLPNVSEVCTVKKGENEQVHATQSHDQKTDMSIMSFQEAPFYRFFNMFKKFAQ